MKTKKTQTTFLSMGNEVSHMCKIIFDNKKIGNYELCNECKEREDMRDNKKVCESDINIIEKGNETTMKVRHLL